MCGIVAVVKHKRNNTIEDMYHAMRMLSYRGYDSHGCLFVGTSNCVDIYRAIGEIPSDYNDFIDDMEQVFCEETVFAVGHTRWATHGTVDIEHCHPVQSYNNLVTLVHNGIFENASPNKFDSRDLADQISNVVMLDFEVESLGHKPTHKEKCARFVRDMRRHINTFKGNNAVIFHTPYIENCLFVFTTGDKKLFRCNNIIASEPLTQNDTWQPLTGFHIFTYPQSVKSSCLKISNTTPSTMLDEIREQVSIFGSDYKFSNHKLPDRYTYDVPQNDFSDNTLTGCGSSYIAAMMGSTIIRDVTKRPRVVHASELALTKPTHYKNIVGISQSGETQDLQGINFQYLITNNPSSSLGKNAEQIIDIGLSKEMAVAATKTFTATALTIANMMTRLNNISCFGNLVGQILGIRNTLQYNKLVKYIAGKNSILLLGSHMDYPIAMEGALKFKEVAGIHAECMPISEMKHGPIALVDKNMPVIFLLTDVFQGDLNDKLRERVVSHIMEIKSRHGVPIHIGPTKMDVVNEYSIQVPIIRNDSAFMQALANVVVLQLLSYDVAIHKGMNPNRPRNLAKCVTV